MTLYLHFVSFFPSKRGVKPHNKTRLNDTTQKCFARFSSSFFLIRMFSFVMHTQQYKTTRENENEKKKTMPWTNCCEQWTSSWMNEMHETMGLGLYTGSRSALKNLVHNIQCAHYNFNLFISLFKGQFVVNFPPLYLAWIRKRCKIRAREHERQ